jgi:hypothetical protein
MAVQVEQRSAGASDLDLDRQPAVQTGTVSCVMTGSFRLGRRQQAVTAVLSVVVVGWVHLRSPWRRGAVAPG